MTSSPAAGLALVVVGIWLGCQIWGGQLVERLNLPL
jgi:hypothetical protein